MYRTHTGLSSLLKWRNGAGGGAQVPDGRWNTSAGMPGTWWGMAKLVRHPGLVRTTAGSSPAPLANKSGIFPKMIGRERPKKRR